MSHSKQLYFHSCKLGYSACLIHICEYNRVHDSYLETMNPQWIQDWWMNTSSNNDWLITESKLNHSVTTMKSDICFMCQCLLTVIIPMREHSETINNTSTTHSIQVLDSKTEIYEEGMLEVARAHRCLDTAHTQVGWLEVRLLHSAIGIPIWYAQWGWNNVVNILKTSFSLWFTCLAGLL